MKPAQILHQLRELQTTWRSQDFSLNEGQKVTYNNLVTQRRERVLELYRDKRVCTMSKSMSDKLALENKVEEQQEEEND